MSGLRMRTLRIVSLNDKGVPDTKERPFVGDLYLAPSRTDPERYDQWIWTGDTLEWQKLGSLPTFDEEKSLREQRVENVKAYFRKRRISKLYKIIGDLNDRGFKL